ncbi:unnamed protein product [Thlaspi arvense]|uniref:Uncharacterized protein n=1 Tax=Thlaspi arvense TaxID=13288 RepID=A0AAU9SCJ3_THLAR|nr:unnamed protein product [Thlaspi arvense]
MSYFVSRALNLLVQLKMRLLPFALINLVGKTYLFKIAIDQENFVYKHDTYKVLKIITNQKLNTQFNVRDSPQETMITLCGDVSSLSDTPEVT